MSENTAIEAPSKEARELCWKARDSYWKCLDDTKENKDKCLKQREEYEKQCSKAWVKHFDRKRDYLKFKAQYEKNGGSSLIGNTNKSSSK